MPMRLLRRRGSVEPGRGAQDPSAPAADRDAPTPARWSRPRERTLLDLVPPDAKPRSRPPSIVGEWAVGRSTLLLTSTGAVHVLDEVATEAWRLHGPECGASEVAQTMAEKYHQDPVLVADDVVPLLSRLPHAPAPHTHSVPRPAIAERAARSERR